MPLDAIMLTALRRELAQTLTGAKVDRIGMPEKDLLIPVLAYRPFLIKPNQHELGAVFGVELPDRESVVPYAKELQMRGARHVNRVALVAGVNAETVHDDQGRHFLVSCFNSFAKSFR